MRVLAVDAGGTTGLARLDYGLGLVEALQLPPTEALEHVEAELEAGLADLVAAEFFTINMRTLKASKAGAYDALHTYGAVRYLAHRAGVPFVHQEPADAMALMTDERLRWLGLYVPRDHARDAVRHAALAAVRGGDIPREHLVVRA